MGVRAVTGIVLMTLLSATSIAVAGDTGTIVGHVWDESGEPRFTATVMVIGTSYGAMTDANGEYIIINLPKGVYELQAAMICFEAETSPVVHVLAGDTVSVDFFLKEEVACDTRIVVSGSTLINDNAVIVSSPEDITPLPVAGIQDFIAGTVSVTNCGERWGEVGHDSPYTEWLGVRDASAIGSTLHFRGSRAGEAVYTVDGVEHTDPTTGFFSSDIPMSAISRISLHRDGFDTLYGSAQSDAVNIITPEGRSSYHGSINIGGNDWQALGLASDSHWGGFDPASPDSGWRWSNVSPFSDARFNAEVSIGGPEPIANYLLPAIGIDIPGDVRVFASGGFRQTGGGEDGRYGYGFDEWLTSYTGNVKLTYRPYSGTMFSLTYFKMDRTEGWFGIGDFWNWSRYEEPYIDTDSLSPAYGDTLAWGRDILYGLPTRSWENSAIGLNFMQTLSDVTYIDVALNSYRTSFDRRIRNDPQGPYDTEWLGEGWGEEQWQAYDPQRSVDEEGFYRAGTSRHAWSETESIVSTLRTDLTTMISRRNQLKAGIELKYFDVFHYSVDVPSAGAAHFNRYHAFPNSGALYLRDRMWLDGVVLDIGARLDYFDPNQDIDPPSGPVDPGPDYPPTLADSLTGSPKFRLNPRLGVSYILSEQGVLHVSYCHYSRHQRLDLMYGGGQPSSKPGEIPVLGDPDLSHEVTVAYEAGLRHELGNDAYFDITAFYRDMSGLVDTRPVYSSGGSEPDFFIYDNLDYADASGFDVLLRKYADSFLSGSIGYTYSVAKGSSSNVLLGYRTVTEGWEPLIREHYLDWDQRHTVSIELNHRVPRGRGLRIAGVPVFEGLDTHLSCRYGSGFPYSQTNQGTARPVINGERYPSTLIADLKVSRAFWLGDMTLNAWCEVDNLFNSHNVDFIADVEWYDADMGMDECGGAGHDPTGPLNNMYAFSRPRTISFGLGLEW